MNLEPSLRAKAYETSQLIPYLGNKRSLLRCLGDLFKSLKPGTGTCVFLDPFAGAGSVSRLARTLGMSVRSNDWEPYSYALNRAWLVLRPSDLEGLFRKEGGLGEALARLNSFHPGRGNQPLEPEAEPYMAAWYAPRDTMNADWRTERLFFTRENAVFLDRVREYIARLGPPEESRPDGDPSASKRWLLLALLILEAATHANTSGVFKAFHKGFGGHGRDALSRILGAMELEYPILPEAEPARVFREDATVFVRRFPADIAYLDPPYNQHQYGSNYHILNTLVRWDRRPEPLDIGADGTLLRKAGIPARWKETWSGYCGRGTARDAMVSLIDSLDARTVVVSYNTEGIVSPGELREIMSRRWDVEARILDYVKYRGGRQSVSRKVRNHELVFVGRPRTEIRKASPAEDIHRLTLELRFRRLLASRFDPEKIRRTFRIQGDSLGLTQVSVVSRMWRFHRFVDASDTYPDSVPLPALETELADLEACEIRTNAEAVTVLVRIARECAREPGPGGPRDARKAAREALTALRKLAHPRYTEEYDAASRVLGSLTEDVPFLRKTLGKRLRSLEEQRRFRLEGTRGREG